MVVYEKDSNGLPAQRSLLRETGSSSKFGCKVDMINGWRQPRRRLLLIDHHFVS
jgi:hypothetical protein